eukprot:scaffold197_cov220-Prasinococcus_capsulatus_cf.AAC.6
MARPQAPRHAKDASEIMFSLFIALRIRSPYLSLPSEGQHVSNLGLLNSRGCFGTEATRDATLELAVHRVAHVVQVNPMRFQQAGSIITKAPP